jgi:TRAP-type C4-dicarboxylate transport system permease small subunit
MNKVFIFEKTVENISKFSDWIARILVIAVMSVTCINALLRLIGLPIPGDFDYIMILGAMAVCFALPYCTLQKGHTMVELVVRKLPQNIQAILDIFISILSLIFFSLICYQFFNYATTMYKCGEITHTAQLPYFPFLYIAFIMFLIFCLVIILNITKSLLILREK